MNQNKMTSKQQGKPMTDEELKEHRERLTNYYFRKTHTDKFIFYYLRLAINSKISRIARSTPKEEKTEEFWARMRAMRQEYLTFEWPSVYESNKWLAKRNKYFARHVEHIEKGKGTKNEKH